MQHVSSKDGTQIAYEKLGAGQPVVLVDGALCSRSFGPMPGLAALLAPHFTVITYDRRGRGDSGDTLPYEVEREVEDIEALIDASDGSALAFGVSSGAALAFEAALKLGDKIDGLAMYEPAYNSDDAARSEWKDYTGELAQLLSADRRGDAAALFMKLVGTPGDEIDGMRQTPMWPMFEAVAPTLAYDAAVLGEDRSVPTKRAAGVAVATLIMNGSASYPFMRDTAVALSRAIPAARYRELEGQTHAASVEVLAPVLIEFFQGGLRQNEQTGGARESAAA